MAYNPDYKAHEQAYSYQRPGGYGGVAGAFGHSGDYGGITDHMGRGPKGYTRSDERIMDDVCCALERDRSIDASGIEVEVEKGIVTLSGTVTDRRMKRHTEFAIENLRGVKDVRNELTINH